MGLSVSAATAILFASSVICFGVLLGAVDKAQNSLVEAENSNNERLSAVQQTHIVIKEVNTSIGSILVENDGNTVLNIDDVQIILNGSLSNNVMIQVEGHPGSHIWAPSEGIEIQMPNDLNGTAVKVIVSNGATAYYG